MPPGITNKQKWFAAIVFAVVACVVGPIIHWGLTRSAGPDSISKPRELVLTFLLTLLAALIAPAIGLAIAPYIKWVNRIISTPEIRNVPNLLNAQRVLLFGASGTGKSALISYLFSAKPVAPLESSIEFRQSCEEFPMSQQEHQLLCIADYRGQNPSQVTNRLPESFAGPDGARLVNAVVFLVDLIPRKVDGEEPNEHVWDDERLLRWLATNPEPVVRDRLEQHLDYIGASNLEILFDVVNSERLAEVHLLITKADLLREAVKRGFLDLEGATLETFVENAFAEVERRIEAACRGNRIPGKFTINLISLKDESARTFFYTLVKKIQQWEIKRRGTKNESTGRISGN